MINWIHRLLNPHCPDCYDLERDKSVCNTCEVLKMQLAEANQREKLLLEKLFPPDLNEVVPEVEPVPPQYIPWRVKQQQLEQADRLKVKKDIENLEEEVNLKVD